MKACRDWLTMIAFHKISVFHPIITRESGLGTKFLVWQQVYVVARGGYDRCDIGGFDPGFLFFRFSPLGLAMRAAARNTVSRRLVGIRVGRILVFGWESAACNWSGGRNDGSIATPILMRHSGN